MLKVRHALLSALCLLPLLGAEALAATAGVTAAVNQNAKSIPPGGGVRTIVLGDNVVQDEKIETDGAGLVQILLADGTTFTVGPNSSLIIDRFVYDPDANTAEVAASLGRGVFRFIGGRTSKTEGGVTLNTPVGTVGIRGGMADLNFSGTGANIAQIDLLFGNEITLNGPNGGDRLFQPGYSIIIGANGKPAVVKTPPGSASIIQQALAGRPGSTGGNSQKPSDDDVKDSGVDEANSGSTPPNPQDIPPPDLNAIDLATPKPNDNHQVAEEIDQGEEELPSPGKQGFSSGILYAQTQTGIVGAPLYDFDGDTRVEFDENGNPTGGKMVVGLKATDVEVGEFLEVKATVRVKNYPGASSLGLNINGEDIGSISGLTSDIEASTEVLPDCDCVDWGTWYADFGAEVDGDDETIGLKGNWITGDIITTTQYDDFATDNSLGTLTYHGKARGFGQYSVETTAGVFSAGNVLEATGNFEVTWNLNDDTGTFDLTDFQTSDSVNYSSHVFSSTADISRGNMAGGMFGGATSPNTSDGEYLEVSGAFINDGSQTGAGVMGSFNAVEVIEGSQDTVFTGSGVFAGDLDSNN
jgi:hypothetical protein